jgi:hypothetical protein
MALPLADEPGLSRNCAEAAGLPSATQKSTKVNMPNLCIMMMMIGITCG